MTLKQWIYYVQFETWLDCLIYNNRYILKLRRDYRKLSKLLLLLTSPYLLVNWLLRAAYAYTFGKLRVEKQLNKEESETFEHEIAIVAIAKNEGLYFREWIEYHRINWNRQDISL